VKRSKNLYGSYPTEFAGSTTKSTNQNEHLKKYVKKEKEPKFVWELATRQNLQPQPKILKKPSKHQIYQSEPKFFQKKYV
jgi:hypothetical protein